MTITKKFDSTGNVTVVIENVSYKLRNPRGRDLAAIERKVTTETSNVESIAVLAEVLLIAPVLTSEELLDLPATALLALGGVITETFPVFSPKAV